jgi:hypothetical protein
MALASEGLGFSQKPSIQRLFFGEEELLAERALSAPVKTKEIPGSDMLTLDIKLEAALLQ